MSEQKNQHKNMYLIEIIAEFNFEIRDIQWNIYQTGL